MKRNRWITYLILSSVIVVNFIGGCQEHKRPIISIRHADQQLGNLKYDTSYTIEYQIANEGKGALLIDTATASCDCTVPTIESKLIEPNHSTTLKVIFNTVDTGYFEKKVVVKSNIDSIFSVVSFSGRVVK